MFKSRTNTKYEKNYGIDSTGMIQNEWKKMYRVGDGRLRVKWRQNRSWSA